MVLVGLSLDKIQAIRPGVLRSTNLYLVDNAANTTAERSK